MATSLEFVQYVADRLTEFGAVRYRKMFGEYQIWLNERPILLACDNTVYVKMLPALESLMQDAERGYPYDGAKEHWIVDPDDEAVWSQLIPSLLALIPPSKPKRKKSTE